MRPSFAILACLALTGLARAAGQEVISPAPDSVSVTIYRDLFALITETRTVDLPEGPVTLSFDGVVETLLPASTVVTDTGRALEERNYDYDPLTPGSLFRRSVGREVLLTRTHERSGKVSQIAATIVSADERGVVLRTPDGHEALYCSGLAEAITFGKIPDGLRHRPRLSIQLGGGPAGPRTVRLSYLAQGFSWKSDYVARLAASGDRIDLQGWVTLRNLTNTSFRAAQVQVVAGKLNLLDADEGGTSSFGPSADYADETDLRDAREARLSELVEEQQEEAEDYDGEPRLLYGCFPRAPVPRSVNPAPPRPVGAFPMYSMEETDEIIVTGVRASDMAKRESLADYQLYRLPWPTDLGARQTKQVVFLDKRRVKVDRFYSLRFDAFEFSEGVEYGASLLLGFENRKSSGLGEPLPEGVLRLFAPGTQGDLFAGESTIHDTAVSEPVELTLAQAIDLDLEISVETDSNRMRHSDTEIARAQVRIANAKGLPVSVEIRQQVRGYNANARVESASHTTRRKFGDYAWRVRVPANATELLEYKIRYSEVE